MHDGSHDPCVPRRSACGRDEQRPRQRNRRTNNDRGAYGEQRKILEHMTADGGEPGRLEKAQRRKGEPLGTPLHEDVDQDRRGDGRDSDQRKRTQPDHVCRERRKFLSARSGGVSVTIREY